MRRIVAVAALGMFVVLLAAAQQAERRGPYFEPVQIAGTVEARYPPNSIAAGTVVLEVTVAADGSVEQVRVVRDIPSLTAPAEDAVKQWTFRAARLNGRPIRSTVPVAFTFVRPVLNPSAASPQR